MKTDDETFIRALRERPDDETTRLVYADWLDDRSDPRAEYLRAEAAWVALPPSDEQYRPLYRRVSQLVSGLEPEWFATVSRMAHLVRRCWEPVAAVFAPEEPTAPPAQTPNLLFEWGFAEGRLRALLAKVFDAATVERRFCAPADFAAFYCRIGGGVGDWDYLLGSSGLFAANSTSVGAWQPENPEIWIEFGGWSDKHWYFVCCDLESSRFGVIAEGHDYHPWMSGSEGMSYRGRNFLHFLNGYLPLYQNRESLDEWPRVPHSEWATH